MTSRNYQQVTIANGATLSSMAPSGGQRLAGIYLPSNFVGTTFELYTVPNGQLAGTGSPVCNSSGPISYTCAANQYIPFDTNAVTAGIDQVQILAGSAQTPANGVTLTLVFAPATS